MNLSALLDDLARTIRNARSFLLTTHECPDGDGIGSLAALGTALEHHGLEVARVLPDPLPPRYRFLDPGDKVRAFSDVRATVTERSWDLGLILDTHQYEMAGPVGAWLQTAGFPVVFLDHHPQAVPGRPEVYGDPDAVATGELVYRLLHDHLHWDIPVEVAEPLYAALSFDTNSFKYIRSNPASLFIAGDLVERGVDTNRIYRHLFASNSREKARLLGWVLSSVQFECEGRLAYIQIPYRVVRELNLQRDDLRDSITHILEINGVEVAATMKEMEPGEIKISLRSKGECSINQVAGCMGGGGHALAAGCDFTGSLEDAWTKLREPLVAALNHR